MDWIGRTAAAEGVIATPDDTRSGVHATSRMFTLMEKAAARLMFPWLRMGECTVAIDLSVNYLTRTPSGSAMRAVAAYLGETGRLHRFSINAFDAHGLVAVAEHTRAVVRSRRLLAQARRRAGRPAMMLDI
jgi:predicted thioesterase